MASWRSSTGPVPSASSGHVAKAAGSCSRGRTILAVVTSQNDRGAVTADHRQRTPARPLRPAGRADQRARGGRRRGRVHPSWSRARPASGRPACSRRRSGRPDGSACRCSRATADELERRRPFGAIIDCLGIDRAAADARRVEIARILEEVRSPIGWEPLAGGAQGEFRVVEAVLTLVEELSAKRPLVVAIDDLQWADPSTILVLHRLGRSVHRLPVLLLCACRPLPRPPDLERLVTSLTDHGAAAASCSGRWTTRRWPPWSRRWSGPRRARGCCGRSPGPEGTRCSSPSWSVAWPTAGPSGPQRTDGVDVAGVGMPPSLTLTILHRLSFLPQRTLDVLRVASVIGVSFTVGRAVAGHRHALLRAAGGPAGVAHRGRPGRGADPAQVPARPAPRGALPGPARLRSAPACTWTRPAPWPGPARRPSRWPSTCCGARSPATPRPCHGCARRPPRWPRMPRRSRSTCWAGPSSWPARTILAVTGCWPSRR